MVLTSGREGTFPPRMGLCGEGAEQARLKVRRAFAIVPPASCPLYFGPQASRRNNRHAGCRARLGACGDGPFVRSVPGYRSVLEDGSGSVEGCFYGMPDKWKALWGLPRLPRRRGLCILVGFTRPLMSVASLLLENHRFAWGDGVCFES